MFWLCWIFVVACGLSLVAESRGLLVSVVKANDGINLNKIVFSEFAKHNITILEMKKPEATLEDAFMKIIKEGDSK